MALSENHSSASLVGSDRCGACGYWALAIIASTSAIALALRSRRDDWIIALSGCFDLSGSGLHHAGFEPTIPPKVRQNPALQQTYDRYGISATLSQGKAIVGTGLARADGQKKAASRMQGASFGARSVQLREAYARVPYSSRRLLNLIEPVA